MLFNRTPVGCTAGFLRFRLPGISIDQRL